MKITRRPEWLQKKISPAAHADMERLLDGLQLHTVCQEAHCPNITECFRRRQATFLILGKLCTRLCSFCNMTKQMPLPVDPAEPERVAAAVQRLKLTHVVVTSPTRDDLVDGGAALYGATIAAIRLASPGTAIELLVPDFAGSEQAVGAVVSARPEILGHNLETVPRLYSIRSGADYRRSLDVLRAVRRMDPAMKTKSGLMLGLGETEDELFQVLEDLRRVDCTYLSLGQYLAPSRSHYPVQEFVSPETFDSYRERALDMGFEHVESGPYVRSSYHAEEYGAGTAHAKLPGALGD